jgi:hypothetical protein
MQVNLIDHTGKGAENPTKYAADLLIYIKNTRLELGPETREKIAAMPADEAIAELDYISKTIRSSWEFVDFTFEILGVTRAFTHQFVRTRVGISFAQQAQRVVDMSGFKALRPQTVTDLTEAQAVWNSVMLMINQGYERLIELGIPNQVRGAARQARSQRGAQGVGRAQGGLGMTEIDIQDLATRARRAATHCPWRAGQPVSFLRDLATALERTGRERDSLRVIIRDLLALPLVVGAERPLTGPWAAAEEAVKDA